VGGAFLAAPVLSMRILGLDTETAKRVTLLARMAAARDVVIGVGTLASRGRSQAGWLLAGAAADTADAVLIATALRQRRAAGLPAAGIALGAVAAAVLAGWAAAGVGAGPGRSGL
jgi:hypothetical protein